MLSRRQLQGFVRITSLDPLKLDRVRQCDDCFIKI